MDEDAKARLQAYMTAYDIAARRYENIYRSMWTIFSYMSAITAALFTFGAANLYIEALLSVALIPIIFWFVTTYLPLDGYGNKCVKDLERLEVLLAEDFQINLAQFKSFNEGRDRWRPTRTRSWMVSIFGFIVIVWLVGLGLSAIKLFKGYDLGPPVKPAITSRVPL